MDRVNAFLNRVVRHRATSPRRRLLIARVAARQENVEMGQPGERVPGVAEN